MQTSWSPTALCTIAAATAESTPPESPQMTRLVPTWVWMRATCSAMTLPLFQSAGMPAASWRKFSRTRWPNSECLTSGCHCTPYIRFSSLGKAAPGGGGVEAHPRGLLGRLVAEEGTGAGGERDGGRTVFAESGVGDLAAELLCH